MDRRQQILEAAARVYAETGYRGATTRRIARAAGVNEVTLFRNFGSKDELIHEAIVCAGRPSAVPRLPEEPEDARAELRAWSSQHLAQLVQARSFIRTCMGESAERPELMARVKEGPVGTRRDVRRYLGRLCSRGLARPDAHADAAAAMLLGALFTDALSRDLMPELFTYSEEEAVALYVDLLLDALGHGSGAARSPNRTEEDDEA